MNGSKVANDHTRFNFDRGRNIRASAQPDNWPIKARTHYCVSCSARISRASTDNRLAQAWTWLIIGASFFGVSSYIAGYLISLFLGYW